MDAILDDRNDQGAAALVSGYRAAARDDGARRLWIADAREVLSRDLDGARAFAAAFRSADKPTARGALRDLLATVSPTTSFRPDTVASMRWIPLRGTAAQIEALHASRALTRSSPLRGRGWTAVHRTLPFDVDPDELLWAAATAPATFTAACRNALRAAVRAQTQGSGDLEPVHALQKHRRRSREPTMSDGTIVAVVPAVRLSLGPEPAGSSMAAEWEDAEVRDHAAALGVDVASSRMLEDAVTWRYDSAVSAPPRRHPSVFAGVVQALTLRIRDGGCDVDADDIHVTTVNRHVMDVVGPEGIAQTRRVVEERAATLRLDDPKDRYGQGESRRITRGWN